MAPQNSWHRVFKGSVEDITAATKWLRSIVAGLGLPATKANDIEVCLEELLTNIVRHGQASHGQLADSPHPLTIALTLNNRDDGIVMTVEDNGRPFDITQAPARSIDKPLDQIEPGGLGIGLIKSFSDNLQYRRTEMGNRVTLQFAL
jgi:serine/threonine-protein kinase RsbW